MKKRWTRAEKLAVKLKNKGFDLEVKAREDSPYYSKFNRRHKPSGIFESSVGGSTFWSK